MPLLARGDVVPFWSKPPRPRSGALTELVIQDHTLGTAAINIAEVYAGVRPGEEAGTEAFLAQLVCFSMTNETGRIAGSLKNRFARQGTTLQLPDMIVTATALEHGVTLMTDNREDFPVPELALYPLP